MSFPSPFSQPQAAKPSLIPPAAFSPAPISTPPSVRHRNGGSGAIWVLGILVLVMVAVAGYFLTFLGPGSSLLGMILALIPFAVVLGAVRVVDRWEPEPLRLVILALAWGAVAAVAIALLVDIALSLIFGARDTVAGEIFGAVIQAPVVEEIAKGLGLLLIFVIARRNFDGPVDGVVYGALVGAGFAFTENIQYFAISFLEGGVEQAGATFFVRGILSPFAHVMFTSLTGFALGLAARRGATVGAALGPGLVGLAGAIVLHALWNGSALLGDFFALYMTLQVPLFVGFILGVVALRREEVRLTRARLGDYADAGWFTPGEVDMLATPRGRKAGLAWAQTLRGDRTDIMKGFIRDATALAAARQRAITGRDPHAVHEESELLGSTAAARAALFRP